MDLVGGADPAHPQFVPGALVKIDGLVNTPELNGTDGVILGHIAEKGRFVVCTRRFPMDYTGNKKMNVKPTNLILDAETPACPLFATKVCPTLGHSFDLQFGISIDVSEAVTLGTPSEFCSGPAAFLDRKFAAPGAKINNISVRPFSPFLPVQWPMLVLTIALTVHMQAIFCEQPSEEKLKSIAFNCGSITLVPQFLIEMNFGAEAANMECAPVLSPATVS